MCTYGKATYKLENSRLTEDSKMNKVWLISGAGRGLGRAFAEEAVRRGDKVIATVRRLNDDAFFQNENVLPVIADVTDKAAVEKAVRDGIDKFGRIDVLINNAGFGISGALRRFLTRNCGYFSRRTISEW